MKDQSEQLLGEIARRNWLILAALTLASLAWRSAPVTVGVLAGGLLAIAGYRGLYRSLSRVIANPSQSSAKGFQIGYFFRLGAMAAALFLLITRTEVNPIGLIVGLSVVVINIFWTTLKQFVSN